MKKVLRIILVLMMCIPLVSCENKAVQEVVDKIDSINEITFESVDAINEAERLYEELSEKEQEKVTNYSALEKARSDYETFVSNEIRNSWNLGNYKEVSEYLSLIDESTAEQMSPEIVDNIINYFDNIDIFKEPQENIISILNIAESVAFSTEKDKSSVISILKMIESFQEENGQYADFVELYNQYSGQIYSIAERYEKYRSYSFTISIEYEYMKMVELCKQISYSGSEEYAVKFVQSAYEMRDGMGLILDGMKQKDKAKRDNGLGQVISALENQQECLVFNGNLMQKMAAILQAMENMKPVA